MKRIRLKNNYNFGKENLILFQPDLCLEGGMILIMAFDGIVTKKVVDELQNLIGFKIDKISEPNKNTILFNLYAKNKTFSLLCSISSDNYRIHLTNNSYKNPTTALNFCMFLRKHILGYKINSIYTNGLERIVFIKLENLENVNKPIYKFLIVELMGKHSNIILNDENFVILDSLRHFSTLDNSQRDIYPTAKYFLPKNTKNDFLKLSSFDDFYNILSLNESEDLTTNICNNFIGFSKSFISPILGDNYSYSKAYLENLYNEIHIILDSKNLDIEILNNNFILKENMSSSVSEFSLNFALDNFYFEKENIQKFTNHKISILNLVNSTLKNYEKRLININNKLSECDNMDIYKLYGELITANLYKLKNINTDSIILENYYDHSNLITIPLDSKFTPSYNAKLYFKKYNKLKKALELVTIQKEETLKSIDYINSVLYELQNCSNLQDVEEIHNEISENIIFKNSILKKAKSGVNRKKKAIHSNINFSFNPLKYIIDGFTVYVGRNNKENDYLTMKFANKNDIWFHTKDVHGSHVVLKMDSNINNVPDEILLEAARLAVLHSKAKNSSNVPVDYCQIRFVRKPSGSNPGFVIYSNNKTLIV